MKIKLQNVPKDRKAEIIALKSAL